MWKAFDELAELGWLKSEHRPRMVAVQSTGCAPIVRAFDAGERFAKPFENAQTIASGIRVPAAVGDFMILDAVRASGGRAIAVDEASCATGWPRPPAEGISVCPEAAACVGAVEQLAAEGWIHPGRERGDLQHRRGAEISRGDGGRICRASTRTRSIGSGSPKGERGPIRLREMTVRSVSDG